MNYKALGMRIRVKRRELNLSQAELAEKADLSPSFFGHIERGTRVASLETLVALCNALQVSPTYLLQESLDKSALGEAQVSRKEIIQELSMSVLERLDDWDDKSDS